MEPEFISEWICLVEKSRAWAACGLIRRVKKSERVYGGDQRTRPVLNTYNWLCLPTNILTRLDKQLNLYWRFSSMNNPTHAMAFRK